MEKDKVVNTIIADYSMMFSEALMLWGEQPKKSFLTCFKQVVKDGGFLQFYAPGGEKKIKVPKDYERTLLKESGSQLADFVSAQAFLYASETIKNNLSEFSEESQKLFDEIKKEIFHTDGEVLSGNEERLLRSIRNPIAHNDDTTIPRVEYDIINKKFTIHFGKGDDTIVLGKVEMFKLLEIYANHINSFHNNKFRVLPNPLVHVPIEKPSEELLKLVDMEKKDIVTPDEHQIEALDGIVDRIRHYGFYPNWLLGLFYPYKQNSWNNSTKMSVLSVYIKDLMDFKDYDLKEFSKRYRAQKYYALDECTCPTDDVSLFMANILFILCTNTSKEILQESMAEINSSVNIVRIRNAIAHGTFFHDKKLGFHFYDGKDKSEYSLGYVGYLSYEDIINLKSKIAEKKFAEYKDTAKITLGTRTNPEPHVKE